MVAKGKKVSVDELTPITEALEKIKTEVNQLHEESRVAVGKVSNL